MPNRYVCLQTEHLQKFQCDGTECQSRCCKGWNVPIDDGAWNMYRKIKRKDARKKILSHISKKNENERRCIKFPPNGICPFLREDLLCSLQYEYGEAYLSSICRTFPRNVRIIGGMMERSLDLSCPVAAKLVLRQREPMAFEQVEFVVEQPIYASSPLWEEAMNRLPELQYAAISLLQNRQLAIDGRLALLGFFMEELQHSDGQEQWDRLWQFYSSDDVGEQSVEPLHSIHFKPDLYLKTMFGLIEALYGAQSELHIWDVQLEHVTKVFALENTSEVSVERLVESYERHCVSVRATLMEKYGYVFENYLVNEFFGNVYPFRMPGNFVQNYGTFLLGYQFLEFLLVAMAADKGGIEIDEDALVDKIGDFTVWTDHTPKYLECVAEEAKKRGGGSVSFWLDLLQV